MIDVKLQLPLSIQLRDEATFANYFVGSNKVLISFLSQKNQSKNFPIEKFIYLYGVSGVGCTHLLQAACHEADNLQQRSIYIPLFFSIKSNNFLLLMFLFLKYTLSIICLSFCPFDFATE